LTFGIALGRAGAVLHIVHIVDETPVVSQLSSNIATFDPTVLIDVLDQQRRALLEAARQAWKWPPR
jgi:hypothetical protein